MYCLTSLAMAWLAHRHMHRVGSLPFKLGLLCSNMSWDLLFPSGFARKEALCWPSQELPFDFLLDPANSHRLWTGHSGTRTSLQWVLHETPSSQWTEWGDRGDRGHFYCFQGEGWCFQVSRKLHSTTVPKLHLSSMASASLMEAGT